MNQDKTLYLLVIDDSSNLAETVSNILRNSGHAVRADRVEDDEDLREAFGKQPWDMILSKPEIPYFTANDALEVVRQASLDIPLILIADGAAEETIDELLKAGARDEVLLANPRRLEQTLLREVNDVRQRRALKLAQKALVEANARAQALVDSSRDAITYVHEGMHIYANDSYLELFGYSSMEEIEGMPIMDMVKSEEHTKFKQFLRDYIQGKTQESSLEVTGIKTDGTQFNVTMEFTPASFEGEPCTQIIIRDQAMSKELEQRLSDMSKMDLLTGAYNRPYFLEALQKVTGKKDKEGVVLAIRPDDYRRIRDESGVAAGDELLTRLAAFVAQTMPGENDFIARFEGDLFTALLHDITPANAERYATQLCRQIDEHIFELSGTAATTPCSIGIGIYNDTLQDIQEVLNRAEKALKEASDAGGKRVRLYVVGEAEMADRERSALLNKQIRLALKNNQLRLLFQPIVSIKGDSNHNYEVFVRMSDESGNDIAPGLFLPAAEEGGLMVAIDRWILAHAIKAVAEQRHAGKPAVLFVKLSGASLKDDKLLPWLRDILKAAHAAPDSLTLSVSESIATNNLKALKILLEGLQQLHVRLALDHFGVAPNFSNLLKHCDADFLKLDGSIIAKLSSDKEAQERVKAITDLAAAHNKRVIGNSVEDPHTLATIYATGIDYIQGYFLQEPTATMEYDFDSM
ncbi:MAG: EAL domain-containing protein [Gammaproteobacteria bacterium]|nr:EAL domain-containing protein [Gammaproteobacteria bacterium]